MPLECQPMSRKRSRMVCLLCTRSLRSIRADRPLRQTGSRPAFRSFRSAPSSSLLPRRRAKERALASKRSPVRTPLNFALQRRLADAFPVDTHMAEYGIDLSKDRVGAASSAKKGKAKPKK